MVNRIVLTEKDQITTLKVIDELMNIEIEPEMEAIGKRLASVNTRKVNLDLYNLQVISKDTHELLGLIIKHVRLQNIPISITGSSQLDPGILLGISEGRSQIIEEQSSAKETFTIKPKYFSRFSTPFFSNDQDNEVFKRVILETDKHQKYSAEKPFLNDKPEDVEIVLPKDVSDKYSPWFKLGWLLFLCFTVVSLTLLYLLWPDYQSGKIQEVFLAGNKTQLALKTNETGNIAVQETAIVSLIMEVKKGNKTAVEELLISGTELELKDKSGYTALMHAVKTQNVELVKLLAESGAEVDLMDEFKDTPLIWASSMKNKAIVKLLL